MRTSPSQENNAELKIDAEENSHCWWEGEGVFWRENVKSGEEKAEGDMLKTVEITVVVDEINSIHRIEEFPEMIGD